jgi:selenocysteine lyase/cysteine desulfurase
MSGRRSFIKKSVLSVSGSMLINLDGLSAYSGNSSKIGPQNDFWKELRSQFPLTNERIYFNNGTIGPSPLPVLEAVKATLTKLNTWGEYSGHDDSRKPLADFTNVTREEISLTHNTTEGINVVAAGLPLKRGDEIIMTTHEHAGNALPWLNQQKQKGIVIKVFTPQNTAAENLNAINDLISSKTRVIAVPHITCTTGHVFPVKEISSLGHDKGLWIFYDGAHSAGSLNLDIRDTGCDFYASCGHKWLLGPSGTGFLFVNQDVQEVLKPISIGAYSDTGWEISEKKQSMDGYVQTAHRYDYGTQSAALAHGLKAAVEFMQNIGMDKVEDYSSSLAEKLFYGLMAIGDPVEILTPEEKRSRSTMITFRIRDYDYKLFGKAASENKFRIRLVPESGLNAIRISTHIYNNEEEVDKFLYLVSDLVKS